MSQAEEYNYHLFYQGVPGGHAVMKFTKNDSIATLELSLQTNKFFDKFYKIRDTITVISDSDNYHLQSLKKVLNEGKYHKKVILNVSEINRDSLKNPIQDEYCGIMMLMDERNYARSELSLNLWEKGREVPFRLVKKQVEKINIDNKMLRSILYAPDLKSLQALGKDKTSISVWMSQPRPSVPLKIRLDMKRGALVLKLSGQP